MTVRELDRLVTKTELNPVTKSALRTVRKAIQTGRCGDTEVGTATWKVEIDSANGVPMHMRFSFKRD